MPAPPEEPNSLQRVLMDRARHHAVRDQQKPPRRTLQHVAAALLALALVLFIAMGFDAFLESMQRVMEIEPEAQAPPPPPADNPMPAYVVPVEPPPAANDQPATAAPGK